MRIRSAALGLDFLVGTVGIRLETPRVSPKRLWARSGMVVL